MAVQEITIDMTLQASDIQSLQENVALLRSQMQEMYNEITELDAMWDGPANDAFNQQFQQDYATMENMCKTFDSIIDCFEFANKEYNSCENSVFDIVKSISI